MTTTLGNVNHQGGTVDRLVECPLCKGLGCVICHETGVVKQQNLDRAREDRAGSLVVLRWWELLVARRERTRQQRAWLADNEPESRLDRLDREHREKREADDAG